MIDITNLTQSYKEEEFNLLLPLLSRLTIVLEGKMQNGRQWLILKVPAIDSIEISTKPFLILMPLSTS